MPLTFIAASPNANANQLYTVRLAMPADTTIRPAAGMSAMVNVQLNNSNCSAVAIPNSAIFCEGDECFVWLYNGGAVEPTMVTVSQLHTNGMATISSGLSEGQIVVTVGVKSLNRGQKVVPMQPKSETNIGGLQ